VDKKDYEKSFTERVNLDKSIGFYDHKEVKRHIVKYLRNLVSENPNVKNQFSASIEMISQFMIFTDSLVNYLEENELMRAFIDNCRNLYPKKYFQIIELYAGLTDYLKENCMRIF